MTNVVALAIVPGSFKIDVTMALEISPAFFKQKKKEEKKRVRVRTKRGEEEKERKKSVEEKTE